MGSESGWGFWGWIQIVLSGVDGEELLFMHEVKVDLCIQDAGWMDETTTFEMIAWLFDMDGLRIKFDVYGLDVGCVVVLILFWLLFLLWVVIDSRSGSFRLIAFDCLCSHVSSCCSWWLLVIVCCACGCWLCWFVRWEVGWWWWCQLPIERKWKESKAKLNCVVLNV